MRQDGAFDDAVKDVDAIEHMASPLSSTTGDPDGMWPYVAGDSPRSDICKEYLKPAVHGTVGIIKSAYKFGYASMVLHTVNSVCLLIPRQKSGEAYCHHILLRFDYQRLECQKIPCDLG